MPTFHLGIEVAKAKLDCALRLPHEKFRTKAVTNTPHGYAELVAWLTANEALDVQVCLKATGGYWEDLAHLLATQGFTVSVVNPTQLKADAASRLTRTKTEAVEARLIAECCAERPPPPWPPRSAAEVALRALVWRLDARLGKLAWREQAKKHRYSEEVSDVTVSRRSSLGSGVAEVVSRPFLSGRGL